MLCSMIFTEDNNAIQTAWENRDRYFGDRVRLMVDCEQDGGC